MKAKKTIQELKPYSVPLFDDEGYLKLDSNENDFGPSPKVMKTLKSLEACDVQYYPYYGKLLKKLADFHNTAIENIILTAGADEAISAIFGTFLEYGQTVLTVDPSFVMPKIYAKSNGLNYKEIPYGKKWEFPEEEFIKNIDDKIDLIHLTTPNSPTGEVIERKVIEKIVEKSTENENKKAVLIDETYGNYSGVTNLDLVKEHDNVFIVRSFSKDFALAGLRLGYIISDSKNIKHLRKYLSPYNVSTLTVNAGIAALEDIEYFKAVKNEMEKSKNLLKETFESYGATVYPSKTNFLCVDFGILADFINHKFNENKIKVKYFNQAPHLNNTFRIAVPKVENAKKVIKAISPKPTIIFDIDGVLIDASQSYRVAIQKTFKEYSGQEVSSATIQLIKNQGGFNNDWDLTEFLLKNHKIEIPKEEIIKSFQKYYWDGDFGLIHNEELLVTKEFIAKLSKTHNLAIFTGRLKKEAMFTLEKHGIAKYFYPIITMDDLPIDRQKPHPLGLEIIKEKIVTNKIYYLGDTVDDMISAKRANIKAIGVLPPQDKSKELKQLLKSQNPMVILNQALEVEEYLYARK